MHHCADDIYLPYLAVRGHICTSVSVEWGENGSPMQTASHLLKKSTCLDVTVMSDAKGYALFPNTVFSLP